MNTNKELKRQLERFKKEIKKAYNKNALSDYLSETEIYNHDFTISLTASGKLEYKSVSIMLAFGGPNIYLDTGADYELIGVWGGTREELYLEGDIVEEIDNYFEDLYECMKER